MSRTPTRIELHRQARELELTYSDGATLRLPCELLRVYSPSAEVRGHGAGDRRLQTGKKYVNIERIDPVGHYGIRIVFDDGHDTGIYSWTFLEEDLGRHQDRYWQQYLDELAAANASRLPAIPVGRWTP
jgi:DUF971 family protein